MTTTLRFTGASDDLVEVEYFNGIKLTVVDDDGTRESADSYVLSEEFNTDNAEFLVTSSETHFVVIAKFTKAGTWAFGVGQADEEFPLEVQNLTLRQSVATSHSALLDIEFSFAKEVTVTKL